MFTMSDKHQKKLATMAVRIEEQTGKSVDEWATIIKAEAMTGFTERVNWLKLNHQLGHFQARMIVQRCLDDDPS